MSPDKAIVHTPHVNFGRLAALARTDLTHRRLASAVDLSDAILHHGGRRSLLVPRRAPAMWQSLAIRYGLLPYEALIAAVDGWNMSQHARAAKQRHAAA
ncbi:MAG: hypothetical protein WAT17_00180 [Candidatus Saccharimonadales bacterium]|jgi:hypothetical protein